MGSRIVGNDKHRAAEWAATRWPDTNSPPLWGDFTALFVEKDGDIQAAVIYNEFTAISCTIHVTALGGRNWLSKPFLSAVFGYPFTQLNYRRVTAKIGANNPRAERFLRQLGFAHEGTHPEGWEPGIPLLSFGLLKEQCRFIRGKYIGQTERSNSARPSCYGQRADGL